MKNLRPHHVVCLTKLYSALLLFSQDKELYYNCIKKELQKSTNLRKEQLDSCKLVWGIIYNHEVMDILAKIITDDIFITSKKSCDSICLACYGNIEGKCVDEERIQIMDTIAENVTNLKINTLINISNIKSNENFSKVCDMCGTRQKCNLIRRAVKNV